MSDTHLGRRIGRHGREGEFDAVLDEITEIARTYRPDLVVHTGDLFDVRMPAVDDMSRGTTALRRLSAIAPVMAIAGNHDSPRLFDFFDHLENGDRPGERVPGRVRYISRVRRAGKGGIHHYPTRAGHQAIRVAALPFVAQNRALEGFGGSQGPERDYARLLGAIQTDLGRGLLHDYRPDRDVLIFAAHLYVRGARPSYSERRADISDGCATAAPSFPRIGYGALGHIHKPQPVARSGFVGRYAGSPLQMDFGESGEVKSVVVVDAEPGRAAAVEVVPLSSGRRLLPLSGTLDQIAAEAGRVGDAFVKVTVHTREPGRDLAGKVERALPRAVIVSVEERCAAAVVRVLDRTNTQQEQPGEAEMFRAHLAQAGIGGINADHVMRTFGELLAAAQQGVPGEFGEEDRLRGAIAGRAEGGANR